MAKYRVKMTTRDWKEKDLTLIALDSDNAIEIAETFNKDAKVDSCTRQGRGSSTRQVLDDIRKDFVTALDKGNRNLAMTHMNTFHSTVASLKGSMNVVAWGKTKGKIPTIPVIS